MARLEKSDDLDIQLQITYLVNIGPVFVCSALFHFEYKKILWICQLQENNLPELKLHNQYILPLCLGPILCTAVLLALSRCHSLGRRHTMDQDFSEWFRNIRICNKNTFFVAGRHILFLTIIETLF